MHDFKADEGKLRDFWKQIDLLALLGDKNKGNERYFVLDGPPYANFIPHVGHIKNTVIKDLIVRTAFMKGFDVFFQPGFDTHGLPVENMVEKELGLKSKKDIEKMGIATFVKKCKELAATNKDLWLDVYEKLGAWYSWKEPYLTYNNDYVESGWWTFKRYWDKELAYEGKKPVFWCPRCETALAGYEVTDSYKMLSDPSIFIKFKLMEGTYKDNILLVFTTTPWTLISNTAVAVHPEKTYVIAETSKGNLILAKERLELLTELEMGYTIKGELKGKELEGVKYEPILDVPTQKKISEHPKAHRVIMSIPILKERTASKVAMKKDGESSGDLFEDFVSVDEGTGLVHTAPGHGKTDHEVGKHYGLPYESPLDDQCKFTEDGGEFQDTFVKKADKAILKVLEDTDRLVYYTYAEHKYPVCWRCKAPLIFRMSNQWFLDIKKIKGNMLKFSDETNWLPSMAHDRFNDWVSGAEDWNISRQRYWGIPMPIWDCECGKREIVSSSEELRNKATTEVGEDFDLHAAGDIKLKCECGKDMTKIQDIFDVWYDSGIAPWASLGYPMKNKELFESMFPIARINEAQDQIRGWFYSLMFNAAACFDKAPYKEVSMVGWIVDKNGDKMSKSQGNVVWAKEGIEDLGADVLRYYCLWDVAPYVIQKFNDDVARKDVYRILNILWNSHIYLTRMCKKLPELKAETIEDRWMLSKLNSIIKSFTENVDGFELHTALRSMGDFIVEDLSRKYIKLVRDRTATDNIPFAILNHAILKVITALAPITPYIAERIYQNLKELNDLGQSIHLEDWVKADESAIDPELEKNMSATMDVIQEILSQREKKKMGVRWPLPSAMVNSEADLEDFIEIIKTQTNIKQIELGKGDLKVELDTKLTKELEHEGYSREIMRRVQAARKKAKLQKEDRIKLHIEGDSMIVDSVKMFSEDIKNKVGATELTFDLVAPKDKFETVSEEKAKEKKFVIHFNKL